MPFLGTGLDRIDDAVQITLGECSFSCRQLPDCASRVNLISSQGMSIGIAMGKAHRLIGYSASFLVASLFYVGWIAVQDRSSGGNVTVLFQVGVAIFFWLFGGVAAALILLALPWSLAVALRRHSGLTYFSILGAALATILGCATSSLAPKPLFVEDQTFLQGFTIALQRQGICLLLTGLVFGMTFWFVSERGRHAPSTRDH